VPIEHFEIAKLLHYKPGETFGRHSDFLQPGMHEEIEARGQRVATFLVYLSDDYDGGETEFTEVGFKFKARKGDALMFVNVDANGATDPLSLHAGLPTIRGEKWVLSQWLRGKPVNPFQTPNITGAPLPPEWYRDA
jgi:prolyl 4-hydroxylase